MEINVNEQTQTVSENTSLYSVIETIVGDKQKGIAVAVNNTVVPKINWSSHILKPNDTVLIIKATQGG